MSSFCTAKATRIFFSKKFQHICASLDINFNESLTNDIVSFEQLGPGLDGQHAEKGSLCHQRSLVYSISPAKHSSHWHKGPFRTKRVISCMIFILR